MDSSHLEVYAVVMTTLYIYISYNNEVFVLQSDHSTEPPLLPLYTALYSVISIS